MPSPCPSRSPSPLPPASLPLSLSCHCHTLHLTLPISRSSLPLPAPICHCTRCRTHFSSLFSTWLHLPTQLSPPHPALDKLVQYPFTPRTKMYACPTCGATCFLDFGAGWLVGSGVVDWGALRGAVAEETGEGETRDETSMNGTKNRERKDVLVRRGGEHCAIEHTGDGGAAVWMSGIEKREAGEDSRLVPDGFGEEMMASTKGKLQELGLRGDWDGRVRFGCGCGKVVGYLSKGERGAGEQRKNETMKFEAILVGDVDERQCSGFEVGAWVEVQWRDVICDGELGRFLEEVKMGQVGDSGGITRAQDSEDASSCGLKLYRSAPGTERYSCSGCGARVFVVDRKRPGRIKIGAGLLKSEIGARAEDWLSWRIDVPDEDEEDKGEEELMIGLKEGLDIWTKGLKEGLARTDSVM
ncbi:hypothetical protein B9Z65_4198 [Elsinoe australis]|uniref:CENP-V/GFA domain-containing protein n=1 Tax=Elsinoe australis TaxID=40998 RepID=A0A2P7Z250_9PEZI|nr:hypothetical protein B9Z65_4198 [Elsinoe australis]